MAKFVKNWIQRLYSATWTSDEDRASTQCRVDVDLGPSSDRSAVRNTSASAPAGEQYMAYAIVCTLQLVITATGQDGYKASDPTTYITDRVLY